MTTAAPPDPLPHVRRSLAPLTAGIWGLAALLWIAGLQEDSFRAPIPAWLLLLVGFAVCERIQLHVEAGRQSLSLSLSELPLIIGLFVVSPLALLAARLIGVALVIGVRRTAPGKAAFNLGLFACEVAVFELLFRALTGWTGDVPAALPNGPAAWLAVALTTLVAGLLNCAMAIAAIGRLQGVPTRGVTAMFIATAVITSQLNASIALLCRITVVDDRRSLGLLAVAFAGLAAGYRAYATLLLRHRSLGLMQQFAADVSGAIGGADLLPEVLAQARQVLRADAAALWLCTEGVPERWVLLRGTGGVSSGGAEGDMSDDPLVRRVISDGRPLVVPRGSRQVEHLQWTARHGLRDAALVPLHGAAGTVEVCLLVGDRLGEMTTFSDADTGLLELVASHVSIALRNGRLVDQLRHDAHHDSLTGLPNRALFHQRLAEVTAATTRIGVVLMDLDGFKDVNDTLGHHRGDELLRAVAERLRAALPASVTIARLGGDEFALLLPVGDGPDDPRQLGALLHGALRHPFVQDGLRLEVRASIGVSVYPEHGDDGITLPSGRTWPCTQPRSRTARCRSTTRPGPLQSSAPRSCR